MARLNGEEILVGNRAFAEQHAIPAGSIAAIEDARATSEVLVARNGRLLGTIVLADAIRPEAPDAIRSLHRLGIKTLLLTGDAWPVASAVGFKLEIDDVQAELLPDEKVKAVRRLTDDRHRMAMVGDGVNDAPALMQATVGIAMGSGTDVARESADIVLLGNDLSKLVETVRIARRTKGIIRFNFVGTLVVDAVGVGLAAFGLLNPLLAAFIHVASELAFILN